MEPDQYDYSSDQHYQDGREALVDLLDEFKQLEKDEPEIAAKLGFLGYANLQVTMNIGSAQARILQKIADNTTPPQKPASSPMQVL